jgi:hypothetical protein
MAKGSFDKKILLISKLDIKYKEENSKVLHLECSFVLC